MWISTGQFYIIWTVTFHFLRGKTEPSETGGNRHFNNEITTKDHVMWPCLTSEIKDCALKSPGKDGACVWSTHKSVMTQIESHSKFKRRIIVIVPRCSEKHKEVNLSRICNNTKFFIQTSTVIGLWLSSHKNELNNNTCVIQWRVSSPHYPLLVQKEKWSTSLRLLYPTLPSSSFLALRTCSPSLELNTDHIYVTPYHIPR